MKLSIGERERNEYPSDLDKLAVTSETEVGVGEGMEVEEKGAVSSPAESVPDKKSSNKGGKGEEREEEGGVVDRHEDEYGHYEAY